MNRQHTTPISRTKKLPAYRSFRLSKPIKAHEVKPLPSSRRLWKDTWLFLWQHRVKILIFLAIYTFTYISLIKSGSGFDMDYDVVKEELRNALTGNIGAIISFISLYATLVSSVTQSAGDVANYTQTTILVLFSLAYIWLIRRLHGKKLATIKDAFYRGSTPLIPFLGVLVLLVLEVVPAGLGALLLVTAQNTDAIGRGAQTFAFGLLALLCGILSIYLLAGSILALYIVTLPGTGPIVAVRSSLRLLRIHRWRVLLRIVSFALLLLVSGFFVALPFIIWLPRYAEIAMYIMSCLSFGVFHVYMYKLYRSLL
jgi:hypothetical protein